jgi:hypothetical protein
VRRLSKTVIEHFPGRWERDRVESPTNSENTFPVVHNTMRYSSFIIIFAAAVLLVACTSSSSPDSSSGKQESSASVECVEPQNPYDEGSGHYAGYEWAQEKNPGACGGNSQSFIEGCEEYERQQSEYEDCEAKKKN